MGGGGVVIRILAYKFTFKPFNTVFTDYPGTFKIE
jgi:hypothetical protein